MRIAENTFFLGSMGLKFAQNRSHKSMGIYYSPWPMKTFLLRFRAFTIHFFIRMLHLRLNVIDSGNADSALGPSPGALRRRMVTVKRA